MLEKTHRVHELMRMYDDFNDIQKNLAKAVVTCFIEDEKSFVVNKEDFEEFYDDYVSPAYAVQSFCELNEVMLGAFWFRLIYNDESDWFLDIVMNDAVFFHLDDEME